MQGMMLPNEVRDKQINSDVMQVPFVDLKRQYLFLREEICSTIISNHEQNSPAGTAGAQNWCWV